MHPCLQIEEIQLLVCSYLDRSSLRALALTCRHLKEPALDSLWRNLSSIFPFFKLFPEDAWREASIASLTRNKSDIVLVSTRELSPADWLSTTPYAPRIHSLAISRRTELWCIFSRSVALACSRPPIFPNLRKFACCVSSMDSNIPLIKIVLSPNLTHLSLQIDGREDAITVLSQLGDMCPSIVSFMLDSKSISPDVVPAVRDALSLSVSRWTQIVELNVSVLNQQAFTHLSGVSNLSLLLLRGNFDDGTLKSLNSRSIRGFSSLSGVLIRECSLQNVIAFLNALDTESLEHIGIDADAHATSRQWEEYFRTLASHATKTSQLSLAIYGDTSDRNGILGGSTLRPIIAAQSLTELKFSTCYHISPTDDDIEEIAQASPNLVTFMLGVSRAEYTIPTMTLKSYRHVFRYCPKIQILGLVIDTDANSLEEDKEQDGQVTQHGKDFRLLVGSSRVNDPSKVATFLLPFFHEPMEYIIVAREWGESETAKHWEQVCVVLGTLIEERRGQSTLTT